MNSCWDIKGCPASHYMDCAAYKQRTSCWKIKQGCCCSTYEICEKCVIYKNHVRKGQDLEAE